MNAREHFAEAERLLDLATDEADMARGQWVSPHRMSYIMARAQVHATLASAAAQLGI